MEGQLNNNNFQVDFYKKRLNQLGEVKTDLSRKAKIWVTIRLIWFLLIAVSFYVLFPYSWISGVGIIASLILFLFFVRKSHENKEKLFFIEELIKINEEEIAAGNGDYSSFEKGEAYRNPGHAFSYDMDLFGEGGFFQLFNRTATKKGERILVNHLLNGVEDKDDRIQAIDELVKKMKWNQEYLAYGRLIKEKENQRNIKDIKTFKGENKKWMNYARYILPILAFGISFSWYFDLIGGLEFIIGFVIVMLPIRQNLKRMNNIHKLLTQVKENVITMEHRMDIFEKEAVSSDLLVEYKDILFNKKKNGKKGLTSLSKLIKETEYRNNVIVAVLLNFFLAWDIRLLINFKKWSDFYAIHIEEWENILLEMETLISGANFRFNYKEHTSVPVINSRLDIEVKEIGHPIIPVNKLVTNDFNLSKKQQFAIVTGPNMAGKSTFLRCIGINLILAQAGFHVFAKQFVFPDVKLYSSMRTNDNLNRETSYFHAELLRLRFIVDAIERGENVFIILDEILKGTNSKDKKEGSEQFLKKLNDLGAKGIIATHDLSLTELAKTTDSIINKYFDTTIRGESISFNYSIQDGVAQNMNASFLLKKMKLV